MQASRTWVHRFRALAFEPRTDERGRYIRRISMTDPADAERRQRQLETLDRLAQRFGASMSDAFGRSAADRKRLDGVLGQVGRTLANAALKGALKPAQASLKTGFESLFKGLFSGEGAPAMPFAKGGVVAAPSYFPLGRGLGPMGEQGAEAILPLARGPDGRLGVRAASGSASARPVSVTVNVAVADAEGFRRSEAQVAAALARAVARGRRGL